MRLFTLLVASAIASLLAAADLAAQHAPSDTYTYQAAGRRDPFVNLLGTGFQLPAPSRRGEGTAGILVNEIALRGVMRSGGSLIAMIQGPDGRNHIIHTGDRFMDGAVKAITAQGLVIVQDVNDPLSLEKQREIRKLLRSAEEARP